MVREEEGAREEERRQERDRGSRGSQHTLLPSQLSHTPRKVGTSAATEASTCSAAETAAAPFPGKDFALLLAELLRR